MSGEYRAMKCEAVTNDVIADYLEGSLDSDRSEEVKAHLASCDSCRARADEIALISGALKDVAMRKEIPVPEEIDDAVFRMIEDIPRPGTATAPISVMRWLLPAAACLLAGVALVWALFPGAVYKNIGMEPSADNSIPAKSDPEDSQNTLALLEKELEKERAEKSDLEKKLKDSQDSISGLAHKIEDLKKESAKEKARADGLALALEEKKESEESLRAGMEKIKTDQESLVARLEEERKIALREMEGYRGTLESVIKELETASAKIERLERKNIELEKALVIAGDFNGDGKADVSDAMVICRNLLENRALEYSREGDANEDGKIDVGDALMIVNRSLSGSR